MRSKLLAGMLAVLIFVPLHSSHATNKTDLTRGDLNGPVKAVRTESTLFGGSDGGCTEGKRGLLRTTSYGPSGNMLEYSEFNFDGSLNHTIKYQYNSAGMEQSTSLYDANNRLLSNRQFDSGSGREISGEDYYSADGSVSDKTSWTYNGQGLPLSKQTVDVNGALIESDSFDAAGNVIEESLYKGDALESKRVYSYDGKGNRIEEVHYGANGALINQPKDPARIVSGYDEANRVIDQTLFAADGTIEWKMSFAYDEHGNLIEQRGFHSGKLALHRSYSYEYDSNGNWIKQTMSDLTAPVSCANPMQVIYRTITYY